ncbi:MAG: hypothetical protein Q4B78_02520 [Bacillota bacterium]|nr:hypothetical protein [Bacillota bacterium]
MQSRNSPNDIGPKNAANQLGVNKYNPADCRSKPKEVKAREGFR